MSAINKPSLFCQSVFVAIACDQLARQVSFYESFLGLGPVVNLLHYAEFQLPALRLGLFVPKADQRAEFFGAEFSSAAALKPAQSNRTPMSLCIEVCDLSAAIARLCALGYPPPGPILPASHGQECYAFDAEGNRLILHQAAGSAE